MFVIQQALSIFITLANTCYYRYVLLMRSIIRNSGIQSIRILNIYVLMNNNTGDYSQWVWLIGFFERFMNWFTVYPKKYAHGFCFAVLSCGYTLTDFPISIRLTSLALWQSNDCPSASKATLMNMDKYFMWIHYERLHNHNKAKHNKTVCIFLGIYCTYHKQQLTSSHYIW